MRSPLDRYRKRMLKGPWQLQGCPAADFDGAVIIPACAERQSLPQTLASLAANPDSELRRWLVVVVINQPPGAEASLVAENLQTLDWLNNGGAPAALQLAWVDAASAGMLLPQKDAGVGLARKLGCDLALTRLAEEGPGLLAWLDADTLVDPSYLPALREHFNSSETGGATLPFAHQPAATPAAQVAIDHYELYLRHYVFGLQLAASPYAYHSIGSTIACRASAYMAAGGMNRRRAGEDFYFLQQLAKTCGVEQLGGTLVQPSARTSQRVPFGTGEKVARLLNGEAAVSFYPPQAFQILGFWLQLAGRWPAPAAAELLSELGEVCNEAAAFMAEAGFRDTWPKLVTQHRQPAALQRAFHGWFDALKTLRLIRRLSEFLPNCEADQAVAGLLSWAGKADSIESPLAVLRHLSQPSRKATQGQCCAMLASITASEAGRKP